MARRLVVKEALRSVSISIFFPADWCGAQSRGPWLMAQKHNLHTMTAGLAGAQDVQLPWAWRTIQLDD